MNKGKKEHQVFMREIYKCSHCGNYLDFHGVNAGRGDANYCPSCGSKMDGEIEGRKEEMKMDDKAVEIVKDYITEHLDKSDPMPNFQVFTVWKCKTLQNWKYLLSSTLFDGMYYELTYNGDKNEWYLDAYKKFQNVVVK